MLWSYMTPAAPLETHWNALTHLKPHESPRSFSKTNGNEGIPPKPTPNQWNALKLIETSLKPPKDFQKIILYLWDPPKAPRKSLENLLKPTETHWNPPKAFLKSRSYMIKKKLKLETLGGFLLNLFIFSLMRFNEILAQLHPDNLPLASLWEQARWLFGNSSRRSLVKEVFNELEVCIKKNRPSVCRNEFSIFTARWWCKIQSLPFLFWR